MSDPSTPERSTPRGVGRARRRPDDARRGRRRPRPRRRSVAAGRASGGSRVALVIVLLLVAVLGGAALFGAGFTLGGQQARTPGTPDDREALFAPFWDAFDAITGRFVGQIDQKTLVEGAIKGMFEALGDPFCGYMSSDEYKA